MNVDELDHFYRRIGAAIWHLQYLEDVLVNFLVAKIVDQRRSDGQTVTSADARVLLTQKRRMTLGPLIQACIEGNIIRLELQPRFEAFKQGRHWLVHRSMVEDGDHLYADADRDAVFSRIMSVQEEALSLKKFVFADFESWISAQGVDLNMAQDRAENALRKLKGM